MTDTNKFILTNIEGADKENLQATIAALEIIRANALGGCTHVAGHMRDLSTFRDAILNSVKGKTTAQ